MKYLAIGGAFVSLVVVLVLILFLSVIYPPQTLEFSGTITDMKKSEGTFEIVFYVIVANNTEAIRFDVPYNLIMKNVFGKLDKAPFVGIGDNVTVKYQVTGSINDVTEITKNEV